MVNLICHGMVFVSAFATLSARAKAVTSDRKPVSPEECRRCIISKALENSTITCMVARDAKFNQEVPSPVQAAHRGNVNGHGAC